MVIARGDIWWANLPDSTGSEPGFFRPVVVVQADDFNRSRLRSVVIVAIYSNLAYADQPGNVFLSASETGLPRDSVANVTQMAAVDRQILSSRIGKLPANVLDEIDEGLRLVLSL